MIFNNTEKDIRKKLLMDNSKINMLCACAFHHEAIKDYKIKDQFWIKPNSGMLIEASNIFSIKLEQSWIIRDILICRLQLMQVLKGVFYIM